MKDKNPFFFFFKLISNVYFIHVYRIKTRMILFKKQLFDLEVKVPRRSLRYVTHCLMVMHPHTKYHWPILKDKKVMTRTKKILFKKTIIWPWGQRSRSHKGHYGMWHTTLWSCTHIPNIIALSGKTKKLWSGQASLRRSRRKNRESISDATAELQVIILWSCFINQ